MKSQLVNKKLLVFGGVSAESALVIRAKELGAYTFVADYREDSPAKAYADESLLVDVKETETLAGVCEQKKIDGIITGYNDYVLPYCQKLCERLNKPFCGNKENIEMCVDKEKFKRACEKAKVPVVPWLETDKEHYLQILDTVELPAVIKPADYSGSKGVYKCFDRKDLKGFIEKALAYSRAGKVLIEKLMDPYQEFSAYYMLYNGQAYLIAMGDRYINIIDPNIAPVGKGMLYPSVHLDEWIEKMDKKVQSFFSENEMQNGFVFLQGFYENGNLYLHEIGYRLNGGHTYDIIEHFCKYNQVDELLNYSLTGKMDEDELQKSDPYLHGGLGMIVTISIKPGKIRHIAGVEEIEKHAGVLSAHVFHKIGDELKAHGTTAQVFAYFLVGVDKREELEDVLDYIERTLEVVDENGNSMLREMIKMNDLRIKEYK